MKTTILLLFFLAFTIGVFSQKGVRYALDSSHIDKKYEKLTGKRAWETSVSHSNDKGEMVNDSAWHWEVDYDYGEPPPEYYEIIKSFIIGNSKDTIRGWEIEFTEVWAMTGYTEGFVVYDIKETCLNNINSRLPIYNCRMHVVYGDTYEIKIFVPDEEMKRRSKEIFKSIK